MPAQEAIPAALLAHAPWSYSKANQAITCPLAFHKKYIIKEERAEPEAQATTVGTVVHQVLEWVVMGAPVDNAFRQATQRFELTHEVLMEVPLYRDAVEDFLRSLDKLDKLVGIKDKKVEAEMAIDADLKKCGYWDKSALYRGKTDLLIFTKDARLIVLDHKSGAVKPIKFHVPQLNSYAVMADIIWPGYRSVRAALHFVGGDLNEKGNRLVWAPEYTIETVRTRFRKDLLEFLARAAECGPTAEPQKAWLCGFCGYKPVCPLWSTTEL